MKMVKPKSINCAFIADGQLIIPQHFIRSLTSSPNTLINWDAVRYSSALSVICRIKSISTNSYRLPGNSYCEFLQRCIATKVKMSLHLGQSLGKESMYRYALFRTCSAGKNRINTLHRGMWMEMNDHRLYRSTGIDIEYVYWQNITSSFVASSEMRLVSCKHFQRIVR